MFRKILKIEFHENLPSGSRVVQCGWTRHTDRRTDGLTDTDRQTDMTKLIVAYRNFANKPKKDQTFIELSDIFIFS